MKKLSFLLLSLLSLFFIGCGPSQSEQLIIDYEQRVDGIKTDLGMKIKDLDKKKVFTNLDSLDIIKRQYVSPNDAHLSVDSCVNAYKTLINTYQQQITELEEGCAKCRRLLNNLAIPANSTDEYLAEVMYRKRKGKEVLKESENSLKNAIEVKADLEYRVKMLQTYPSNEKYSLGEIYTCTYTIRNPILNATQEHTKDYFINTKNGVIAQIN